MQAIEMLRDAEAEVVADVEEGGEVVTGEVVMGEVVMAEVVMAEVVKEDVGVVDLEESLLKSIH